MHVCALVFIKELNFIYTYLLTYQYTMCPAYCERPFATCEEPPANEADGTAGAETEGKGWKKEWMRRNN